MHASIASTLLVNRMLARRTFLMGIGAAGLIFGLESLSGHSRARADDAGAVDPLEQGFRVPPDAAKAWVYWWWLGGAASVAGITADLETMKEQGISGVLLFDAGIRGAGAPMGPLFMSDEWRENFRHAVREAARLGIEMGVNLCSGWNAGGPWVTRDDAVKNFVWKETVIDGPSSIEMSLPRYIEPPPPSSPWAHYQPCVATDYYRDIAVLACRERGAGVWRQGEIQDLTNAMQGEEFRWRAPAGRWTILRMGYVVRPIDRGLIEGQHCLKLPSWPFPAWEIDPMSAEAMDRHFAATAAKLIEDAGPNAGQTFKYTHIDSWELGVPTWTPKLTEEFKKRRNYDAARYLPALCQKVVDSAEITERFKWDYRRTVADLIAQNYYGRLATLSHQHGLLTHPESGGPYDTQYIDSMETESLNDVPMGEFWAMAKAPDELPGVEKPADLPATPGAPQDDPNLASESFLHPGPRLWAYPDNGNLRQAVNAAHVYGKRVVQAEAYTNYNSDWTEDPYFLKPFGDQAYCVGLTRQVLCFYVHQSTLTDKPGYQWEHVGTHFDRNITWWSKSHAWLTYLGRCQHLLQQGTFAADVLYFAGEGIPNFATLHRKPMAGFDFDVINAQALLTRAMVRDGKIVLPDGISYQYLVFPKGIAEQITPAVLGKIRELVESGATLVGARPQQALGLTNYPHSDEEVKAISTALWGPPGSAPGVRRVGSGRVISGTKLEDVIKADKLHPDVELRGLPAEVNVDWIHRREANIDLYFVANLGETVVDAEAVFRVGNRVPELWDPVTGEIRDLPEFHSEGGRTALPIHFAAKQSWFVVFRKPATSTAHSGAKNFAPLADLATLQGPWEVAFDESWGAPARVIFQNLDDWSLRPEDEIKHYSGTATYRNVFDVPDLNDSEVYLDLGEVKNLAHVRLNGKDLGVIWTAPWHVFIGEALRGEGNQLEIEVVNLWPNRLIGDGRLPKAERRTKTNVRTYDTPVPADMILCPECTELAKIGKPRPLLRSGLLGPVKLRVRV
jgi:hypothetical protein